MRMVFLGSDDFAAVHLNALLRRGHEVCACVTVPDKPQGRGMVLTASPIKQMAVSKGIPCLQPVTLKDDKGAVEPLRSFAADLFVVVAYGRLLTQEILDIPKILCLNVHGSLLPRYRGAAPINWAILNGETETGVTIQKMALALDAGDIIAQERMTIGAGENAATLRQRMAEVGAGLLGKVLDQASAAGGQFPLCPQDETQVTYAPRITKEMGRIHWEKSAHVIVNQVRGLQPWPGAVTSFQGKAVKITKAGAIFETMGRQIPGEILKITKEGLYAACGQGSVLVMEVQPEAGKVMPAASFAAGHRAASGSRFE